MLQMTKRVEKNLTIQRRQQIILQDDPSFDPMAMLPGLDKLLDSESIFNFMSATQESANKYSQMSPLDNVSLRTASSSRHSSIIGLELPPSSHSIGSYQLPGDLGRHSSPFNKCIQDSENMADFMPFADNEFDPICGVGLDFDADGNLVGILDGEPELPPLRGTSPDPLHTAEVMTAGMKHMQLHDNPDFGDDNLFNMGEAALPEAEPFLAHPASEQRNTDAPTLTTETTESGGAVAPYRATRRRGFQAMIDQELRVSRDEFRGWTENYAKNMQSVRKRIKATTQAQAKRNAIAILYNNGLSGVGTLQKDIGINHPLALEFAGTALKAHLLGLGVNDIEDVNPPRGRRRKSPEAFKEENEDVRNVRQRLEPDELARGDAPVFGDGLDLGEDTAFEIGLEAAAALGDKHSSSLMPWSRPGSAAPGSATRAPGSAQKSVTAPSPLHGRGSAVGSVERHSDPFEDPLGAAGFGSQLSSIDFGEDQRNFPLDVGNDTQASTQGLDSSSQRFLGYVAEQAFERGVIETRGSQSMNWIEFEELANPETHSKAIAAQAFLHVLSLATRNVISVEQDGIENKEPFGTLRVGLSDQFLNTNIPTVD